MNPLIPISDLKDPRVQQYAQLRAHILKESFIVDGTKTVLNLLRSCLSIKSIFAHPDFYSQYASDISKRKEQIDCFVAPKDQMTQITGHRLHQAVMAQALTPPPVPIESLEFPIIVFNQLEQAENIGAIIRTAIGMGVKSFVFDRSSPYLRRVVRVSMGGIFFGRYSLSSDLRTDLKLLKEKKGVLMAAECTEGSVRLDEVKMPQNLILILGNEGRGVDPTLMNISDKIVEIPIEQMSSYNVASSAALFLWEWKKLKISNQIY